MGDGKDVEDDERGPGEGGFEDIDCGGELGGIDNEGSTRDEGDEGDEDSTGDEGGKSCEDRNGEEASGRCAGDDREDNEAVCVGFGGEYTIVERVSSIIRCTLASVALIKERYHRKQLLNRRRNVSCHKCQQTKVKAGEK